MQTGRRAALPGWRGKGGKRVVLNVLRISGFGFGGLLETGGGDGLMTLLFSPTEKWLSQ